MILTSTVVQSKQFYWYLHSKRHECNFSLSGYIGVEIWEYLPKWKDCSVNSVGPVSVGMTNNQAILAVENVNVYFLSKLYVHRSLTREYCPLQSFGTQVTSGSMLSGAQRLVEKTLQSTHWLLKLPQTLVASTDILLAEASQLRSQASLL